MMTPIQTLRDAFVQFARDEDGSQSVEMMLMIPLFVWSYLATWVFFDAYRVQSINAKASYTIGDYLSREREAITPEYIDSMHHLQRSLVNSRTDPRLRITFITYHGGADQYIVCWSRVRGSGPELSTADLVALRPALPEMPTNDIAILVQTSVDYVPVFAAGISRMDFDDFVVTSPRAGQGVYNSVNRIDGQPDPIATQERCPFEA